MIEVPLQIGWLVCSRRQERNGGHRLAAGIKIEASGLAGDSPRVRRRVAPKPVVSFSFFHKKSSSIPTRSPQLRPIVAKSEIPHHSEPKDGQRNAQGCRNKSFNRRPRAAYRSR